MNKNKLYGKFRAMHSNLVPCYGNEALQADPREKESWKKVSINFIRIKAKTFFKQEYVWLFEMSQNKVS